MKNIDKERFAKLSTLATDYAKHPGFETLKDSISGANLALCSFVGHLMLTDDELNEIELLAFQVASVFLERLSERNNK